VTDGFRGGIAPASNKSFTDDPRDRMRSKWGSVSVRPERLSGRVEGETIVEQTAGPRIRGGNFDSSMDRCDGLAEPARLGVGCRQRIEQPQVSGAGEPYGAFGVRHGARAVSGVPVDGRGPQPCG